MSTRTRFEEEAKGNSEMAYYAKERFDLLHCQKDIVAPEVPTAGNSTESPGGNLKID